MKARLYDQDGNPINLQRQDCATSYGPHANQDSVTNAFPLSTAVENPDGYTGADNCQDSDKAPFVPPPAPATTPPSAGPTTTNPSGTPNATPTPSLSGKPPTSAKPGATLPITPTR